MSESYLMCLINTYFKFKEQCLFIHEHRLLFKKQKKKEILFVPRNYFFTNNRSFLLLIGFEFISI